MPGRYSPPALREIPGVRRDQVKTADLALHLYRGWRLPYARGSRQPREIPADTVAAGGYPAARGSLPGRDGSFAYCGDICSLSPQ